MTDDRIAEAAQLGEVDAAEFSDRERLAVRYAEAMHGAAKNVRDAVLAEMLEHFTPAEYLELAMSVGQFIALGQMFTMLGIPNSSVLSDGQIFDPYTTAADAAQTTGVN